MVLKSSYVFCKMKGEESMQIYTYKECLPYLNQNKVMEEGETYQARNQKHDKIFKEILDYKKEGVKLLNKYLDLKIEEKDIEKYTRKFVLPELENRESDVIYKLKNEQIFFLIEHQTKVDYSMPFRLLEYEVAIIRSAVDKSKIKNKSYKIPLVMPIVLYTGKQKWNANKYLEKSQEKIQGLNIKIGNYSLVDINNFKELNDKYGQSSGDDILRTVADKLKRIFKNQNIFRVSGDEFYIFSEDEFLIERLERLKKEMHSLKLSYQVDLSIGFYKNNNKDLETAFKYGYMAMEDVKKKNNFYYIEATEDLIKKKEREYSIKSLLRNKNLKGLYGIYQPKFSIKSKEIIGAEALARWSDEKLGFISPGEFIAIAEEINLIHLIDYKIASDAISFVKKLKENGYINDNFKMSFNLSMKSLERDDVVSIIKNLLKENGISGDYMEIEITESIFSTNLKTTLEKINELKKINISFSMDDFTAGHSTVSLLPLIPLDVIKFDKGILDAIGTKGDLVASNIYMALVGLIKDLNLKIVSEGIETKLQLEFLEKANVDIGQGYIFSKPIEDLEFIKKLTKKNTGS